MVNCASKLQHPEKRLMIGFVFSTTFVNDWGLLQYGIFGRNITGGFSLALS